jgi:hypothetical protein
LETNTIFLPRASSFLSGIADSPSFPITSPRR